MTSVQSLKPKYRFSKTHLYWLYYDIVSDTGDVIGNVSGTNYRNGNPVYKSHYNNRDYEITCTSNEPRRYLSSYVIHQDNTRIGSIEQLGEKIFSYSMQDFSGVIFSQSRIISTQLSYFIFDCKNGLFIISHTVPRRHPLDTIRGLLRFKLNFKYNSPIDRVYIGDVTSSFEETYFVLSSFIRCSVESFDYSS